MNKDTVFPPANTQSDQSDQSHNSDNAMLIRGPEASSDFTYSVVAHDPDQSDTALLVPGVTKSDHNLYQYSWFYSLMVLIYGLTLGIAGTTLWLFAYYDYSIMIQYGFVDFVRLYGPWFAYDAGIVWIFILASLYLSHTHLSAAANLPVELELHHSSHVRSWWAKSFTCNSVVVVLLGSSAAMGYLTFSSGIKLLEI